jgi:alkylated DNA repair protein alkB family protein 8
MNEKKAEKIIKSLQVGYDQVAQHFSDTRFMLWPEMRDWKNYIKDGQNILDIGCGNGRLLELFAEKKVQYTGLDISAELIKIANKKCQQYNVSQISFQVGDMRYLPFANDSYDLVFAVSALHHLPHHLNRWLALSEIFRVLRPGGLLLMTNWYLWNTFSNRKFQIKKQTLLNWWRGLDIHGLYIPWKDVQGKIQTQRYYYAFKKRELASVLEKVGFEVVLNKIVSRQEIKEQTNTFESLVTIAKKI